MYYKYHAVPYNSKDIDEDDLYALPVQYTPQIIYALEQQKDINDWTSREEWVIGYQHICRIQWELLMGAKNDIIREIRGVRGSYDTNDDTVETWPVGSYPGFKLININNTLFNVDGKGTGILLGEIRDILQTQGAGEQGQLDALLQIVALLSV